MEKLVYGFGYVEVEKLPNKDELIGIRCKNRCEYIARILTIYDRQFIEMPEYIQGGIIFMGKDWCLYRDTSEKECKYTLYHFEPSITPEKAQKQLDEKLLSNVKHFESIWLKGENGSKMVASQKEYIAFAENEIENKRYAIYAKEGNVKCFSFPIRKSNCGKFCDTINKRFIENSNSKILMDLLKKVQKMKYTNTDFLNYHPID